jgi:hypothetical protein
MTYAARKTTFNRIRNNLGFAGKVLIAAALVELLLFAPLSQADKISIFWPICIASAVLGGFGFYLTLRQLEQLGFAVEGSVLESAFDMAGWRVQASVKLTFYFSFIVPMLNLVSMAWAYLKGRSAIRAIDHARADDERKEAMKNKLRSGPVSR